MSFAPTWLYGNSVNRFSIGRVRSYVKTQN